MTTGGDEDDLELDNPDLEPAAKEAISRAFGAENRRRILSQYLAEADEVTVDTAWKHIYRLLLWINPTISLAHCYESDKCQPHKAWYPRSLAFHAWTADQVGVSAQELHDHIDYLFRTALPDLARVEAEARRAGALKHLAPYAPGAMPLPGDDPDLVELILGGMPEGTELDDEQSHRLIERIYAHFGQENKRKNLLGRGFEDALVAVIQRLPGHERWQVGTRVHLEEIPGFVPQSEELKAVEVDLALWEPKPQGRRILVSAKWSVRADRERQFDSDFEDYSKANVGGLFDYVLITNEFDAARLDAACNKVIGRGHLFSSVVHVQPEGVLTAYGPAAAPGWMKDRYKSSHLVGHVETGRLIPLGQWLSQLIS